MQEPSLISVALLCRLGPRRAENRRYIAKHYNICSIAKKVASAILNALSYNITFPTTSRTLQGEYSFKPGFGVITGANESKSFIIEVVRWCLFGSAALRGRADDYKTLQASLAFSTRGQDLRPTERKRMVDSVIGLDRFEDVARWAGEEARGYEKVEVLGRQAGLEPKEPEELFDQAQLDHARAAHEELHRLRGVTSVKREKPVEPTCSITTTAEQLKPLAAAEQERNAEIKMLQGRLKALPQPSDHTDERLSAIEQQISDCGLWLRRIQFEKRHPRSIYARGALQAILDDWTVFEEQQSVSDRSAQR